METYDPNNDSFASIYPDDDPEIAGQLFVNEHSPDYDIVGINLFGHDSVDSPSIRNVESYGSNQPMTLSELDTSNISTTPLMTPPQSNSQNSNTFEPYANTFEPYNTP